MTEDKRYEVLGQQIGKLVDQKNKSYGDSFHKAADFLRLLFPNGVPVEKYGDMLCLVRIFDKQMRIATDPHAFGESPYQDIAGYGLLGKDRVDSRLKALEMMANESVKQLLPSE